MHFECEICGVPATYRCDYCEGIYCTQHIITMQHWVIDHWEEGTDDVCTVCIEEMKNDINRV